jgi:uncharacterized protein
MSIKDDINGDLKKALLSNDKQTATTLRGLKSIILDAEISEGKRDTGLSEEEVIKVLVKAEKQRKESASMYDQAGETERAAAERQEIGIIKQYLPEEVSEEKINSLIDDAIAGATDVSLQSMGMIIGKVKNAAGPTADGGLIAKLVKDRLGSK